MSDLFLLPIGQREVTYGRMTQGSVLVESQRGNNQHYDISLQDRETPIIVGGLSRILISGNRKFIPVVAPFDGVITSTQEVPYMRNFDHEFVDTSADMVTISHSNRDTQMTLRNLRGYDLYEGKEVEKGDMLGIMTEPCDDFYPQLYMQTPDNFSLGLPPKQ